MRSGRVGRRNQEEAVYVVLGKVPYDAKREGGELRRIKAIRRIADLGQKVIRRRNEHGSSNNELVQRTGKKGARQGPK